MSPSHGTDSRSSPEPRTTPARRVSGSENGSRSELDEPLRATWISGTALRARTRHAVRVGQVVSCRLETPDDTRSVMGQVERCEVAHIGTEGLIFEIDVRVNDTRQAPLSPSAAARHASMAVSGAARGGDEGPDLDGLIEALDTWDMPESR